MALAEVRNGAWIGTSAYEKPKTLNTELRRAKGLLLRKVS